MVPMSVAAVLQARPQLSILFIILLLLLNTFVCTGSSLIRYNRQSLLDIRSSKDISPTPDFSKWDFAATTIYPPNGLPDFIPVIRKRRRRKRSRRAGALVKLRRREHRPPLPSILLANVQSLDNKLDELRGRLTFQRDIKNCNVLIFTETWLDPSIPATAIQPEGFTIHRLDRTKDSGKNKGGGVCFMINNSWCSDVEILTSSCSPDLEHLMIKCRPFYLPREFSSVIITAVYIPPQADANRALNELYGTISRLETSHPEAAFIVAGDFNKANLKKVLPKYHQHITCPTRAKNTLDHVYTPFRDGYKALPSVNQITTPSCCYPPIGRN